MYSFLNSCDAAALVVECETGSILYANEDACAFYGVEIEGARNPTIFDLSLSPHKELKAAIDLASLGAPARAKLRRSSTGSEPLDIEACVVRLRTPGDTSKVLIFHNYAEIGSGATAPEPAQSEKLPANEWLKPAEKVIDVCKDAMLVTDRSGRIIHVNQAFEAVTGFRASEALGSTPSFLKAGRGDADVVDEIWDALRKSGSWEGEIRERRKSGEVFPAWLSIQSVADDLGPTAYLIAALSNPNAVVRPEPPAGSEVHYEALTGLPNRILVHERVRQALADAHEGGMIAVLHVNLDRFKGVNDLLGYEAGDEVLRGVADRIKASVREWDTVGRLGGDDFAVVMGGGAGTELAARTAAAILAAFKQPFHAWGKRTFLSASIGVAIGPSDGRSADRLISHAAAAMRLAKQMGRNNFQFYSREMNVRAAERLQIEQALRRAVDRQELRLHYQPILDFETGGIAAAEALVRWEHPERGLLAAEDFISVAEEAGMMPALGDWVLRTACRRTLDWREEGFRDLTVSVNFGATQMTGGRVAQIVRSIERTGLPVSAVELDITESAILQDTERIVETLGALREKGVRIAIDDFGTGYSSLSYLKRFPIDSIKIDRTFIRNVHARPEDAAIVEALIDFARRLGIRIVAEGVETEEEFRFLRDRGCHLWQGFHFSPPVESDRFFSLLESHGSRRYRP